MKIVGDYFRNICVVQSYISAILLGAVSAEGKDAHPMHVSVALTAAYGILWLLARFLYKRGYRVALVWTKETV